MMMKGPSVSHSKARDDERAVSEPTAQSMLSVGDETVFHQRFAIEGVNALRCLHGRETVVEQRVNDLLLGGFAAKRLERIENNASLFRKAAIFDSLGDQLNLATVEPFRGRCRSSW